MVARLRASARAHVAVETPPNRTGPSVRQDASTHSLDDALLAMKRLLVEAPGLLVAAGRGLISGLKGLTLGEEASASESALPDVVFECVQSAFLLASASLTPAQRVRHPGGGARAAAGSLRGASHHE